jgi:hypothetical protein
VKLKSQSGLSRFYTIVLILVFSTLVLYLVGLAFQSDKDVGKGTEYTPPDSPAILSESEHLYEQLGSDYRFSALRVDLAYFARATIAEYRTGSVNEIVFKVIGNIEKSDNTLSFNGEFSAGNTPVNIVIGLKNYDRMLVSITNKNNQTNIDSELPSNSKLNKFISTLPIDKNGYHIGYSSSDESFEVNLYISDSGLIAEAQQVIKEGLGLETLDSIKVGYTYPTPSFNQ